MSFPGTTSNLARRFEALKQVRSSVKPGLTDDSEDLSLSLARSGDGRAMTEHVHSIKKRDEATRSINIYCFCLLLFAYFEPVPGGATE